MTGPATRQRRTRELKNRMARGENAFAHCQVHPCENRPTAATGEGLNRRYCRKHIEHYRRHGSYVKKSYGAGELRAYRSDALRWLQTHAEDEAVQIALDKVRMRMSRPGAPVEAFRLAGLPPEERARNVWAKLRQRRVDPMEVLAAWLAVRLRLRDDPQPDRHQEYRNVQAAKLLHRMAGGTHKRWERERAEGRTEVTEMHRHPVSRGLVLRVLGKQLAEACDGVSLPR